MFLNMSIMVTTLPAITPFLCFAHPFSMYNSFPAKEYSPFPAPAAIIESVIKTILSIGLHFKTIFIQGQCEPRRI